MNRLFSIVALSAAAALTSQAQAQSAMLYKSIGANGTVMFSSVPPADDSQILEQRPLSSRADRSGVPAASGIDLAAQFDGSDAALARANSLFDLAEHSLALARRNAWAPGEGMKLASHRASRTDDGRIEFYKRNVLAARHALMEILRDRMVASR